MRPLQYGEARTFQLQLPVVTLGLEYSSCADLWLNNSVRRWFAIMMFLSI